MFCGLCEEGCPTEPKSIWLTTKTYELASYDRWNEPLRRHGRAAELDGVRARRYTDEEIAWMTRPGRPKGRRSSSTSLAERFALAASRSPASGDRLRNPMYGALSLLVTFLAVAALFLLRHAEFLAAVQIFVYGGGIMVLFLFVIMLVNLHAAGGDRIFVRRGRSRGGVAGRSLASSSGFGCRGVHVAGGPASRAGGRPERRRAGPRQLRGGRLEPLPRLPPAVRDRLALPAGGDDRRDRPGPQRSRERSSALITDHALPGAVLPALRHRDRSASSCGAT